MIRLRQDALLRLVVGAAAVTLWAPASAGAATVRADNVPVKYFAYGPKDQPPPAVQTTVTVTGDPLAAEDLTIRLAGSRVVVHSVSLAITAGVGCDQRGTQEVHCRFAERSTPQTTVAFGDGDDRLRADTQISVRAGAGNDLLELMAGGNAYGEDGDDVIKGGREPLVADGGLGVDHITGGESGDRIDGGAGRDVLDGAKGFDVVSWSTTREPVRADLTDQGRPMGPVSAPDAIRGFEGAVGGQGDDVLRGDGARNTLSGQAGDDALFGGGGDDELDGDEGDDRLFGEAGNDTLNAYSQNPESAPEQASYTDLLVGGAGNDTLNGAYKARRASRFEGGYGDDSISTYGRLDHLVGGPGKDSLAGQGRLNGGQGNDTLVLTSHNALPQAVCGSGLDSIDLSSVVPPDCERVYPTYPRLPARPTIVGRSLTLNLPAALCYDEDEPRCAATLTVVDASSGRTLGSDLVRLTRGRGARTATIKLTRALNTPLRLRMRILVPSGGPDLVWTAWVTPAP